MARQSKSIVNWLTAATCTIVAAVFLCACSGSGDLVQNPQDRFVFEVDTAGNFVRAANVNAQWNLPPDAAEQIRLLFDSIGDELQQAKDIYRTNFDPDNANPAVEQMPNDGSQ